MTIKQFIEEAKKIGCKDAYVTADVQAGYNAGCDERTVIEYRCYCSAHKFTKWYLTPQDALAEFRVIHNIISESQDMVLTEETHEN